MGRKHEGEKYNWVWKGSQLTALRGWEVALAVWTEVKNPVLEPERRKMKVQRGKVWVSRSVQVAREEG